MLLGFMITTAKNKQQAQNIMPDITQSTNIIRTPHLSLA